MITCFIRYEIDPYKQQEFQEYSRQWGKAIPECGANLIGYFAPHEGSLTTGYGVYSLDSLADYERYKARLAAHPIGKQNYAYSQEHRFIRSEERIFLKLASSPVEGVNGR